MQEIRLIIKNKVRLLRTIPNVIYPPAIIDDLYFSRNERLRFVTLIESGNLSIHYINGFADKKVKKSIDEITASKLLLTKKVKVPIKKVFIGWLKIDEFNLYGYVELILNLKNSKRIISAEFEVDDVIARELISYLKQKFGNDAVTDKSVYDLLK